MYVCSLKYNFRCIERLLKCLSFSGPSSAIHLVPCPFRMTGNHKVGSLRWTHSTHPPSPWILDEPAISEFTRTGPFGVTPVNAGLEFIQDWMSSAIGDTISKCWLGGALEPETHEPTRLRKLPVSNEDLFRTSVMVPATFSFDRNLSISSSSRI